MADPISWIAAKVGEWVAMTVFQLGSAAGLSVSTAATIANVSYFAAQGLVYAGAFGLSAVLGASGIPSAEQGKAPVNGTTPFRQHGTGRARLSGKRVMWESIPGWNVEIVWLHEGPIDAFEAIYLNDDLVTLDADGWVQPLEGGRYGNESIRILTRRGAAGETAFPEIAALFAEAGLSEMYGEDHIGHGVAKIAVLCKAVSDKKVIQTYPNGPPLVSAVARLSRVYDWRDPAQDIMDPTTWAWSENAVVNHVHFEWLLSQLPIKVDGYGWIQGDGRAPPPSCLEIWTFDFLPRLADLTMAADIADEDVPLNGGGEEPRYRQGGWWELNAEPAAIRARFMDCYDGRMVEASDGAFLIQAGKYVAPTGALTDRHITSATWNRGAADKDKVNVLTGTFTSPAHGYSAQEGQAWRDEDSIQRLGELTRSVDLAWVPSFTQFRRLLKRMMSVANARRNGEAVADWEGLNHIEDRYLRITRRNGPASMRDVVVEVRGGSLDLAAGRVPLSIVQADPNIDAWNPATEEGLPPSTEERAPSVFAPIPEIVSAYAEAVTSGGGAGMRIRIRFEDPNRPGLDFSLGWRPAGSVSWIEEDPRAAEPVGGDDLEIVSGIVPDGDIEVRVIAWSGGSPSDPSDIELVEVAAPTDAAQAALDAWLDHVTVQPGPAFKAHLKTLIAGAIDCGYWALGPRLALGVAHDAQAATVDLRHPATKRWTPVGGVTFTAYRGWTGDGATGYVDSGEAASAMPGVTINSVHLMAVNTGGSGSSGALIGAATNNLLRLLVTGSNFNIRLFDDISDATALTGFIARRWAVRASASDKRKYRNATVIGAPQTTAPTSMGSGNLVLLHHDTTLFSGQRIGLAACGGGGTDAAMITAMDAHILTFLTAIGCPTS